MFVLYSGKLVIYFIKKENIYIYKIKTRVQFVRITLAHRSRYYTFGNNFLIANIRDNTRAR